MKHFTTLLGDKYFTVRGKGDFPLAMLHHDKCFPCQEEDVEAILSTDLRRVRLCSRAKATPSVEVWQAFGWQVEVVHTRERALV